MGLKIKDLVSEIKRPLTIANFFDKTLTIDSMNILYQILYSVRDSRGKLLKNKNGDITSHLVGLFNRNNNFLTNNITPIYCFDGEDKSNKLKRSSNEIKITKEILDSSKKLLSLMGINYIESPSEGESQCCELVKNGDAWGVVSQDYDVLTYNGERLIRNLTLSKKEIEYISLPKFLEFHKINHNQLIDFAILIGNDFFSGVFGIGEKKAIKLVQEFESIENMNLGPKVQLKDKTEIKRDQFLEDINFVRNLFLNPNVKKDYKIKRKKIDYDGLAEFLIEENDFDSKRTKTTITKLRNKFSQKRQIPIFDFIKIEDDEQIIKDDKISNKTISKIETMETKNKSDIKSNNQKKIQRDNQKSMF